DSGKANPVFVMTGPTIAPEVARGVLTTALIAAHDHTMAKRMADRLTTKTLSLQPADDPLGAELWGAFKNPVALACGIVDGLGPRGGDNLKAALVTAGFREGQRLLPTMGASPETAFTAAGLGDMYVTSTSPSSRNRTLGEMLGSGLTLEDALGKMHMVAEGVRAARMFLSRAAIQGTPTPFLHALCDFLDGGISVDDALSRMIGSEV
ncbi:MAG: NAD(P)H-dependent glycerol-3-phosphate dehydrogenase, partial [Candidatus Thermoplasmatota archaeon]|nr:NAD(P)H-dependent glycerol-3-phosphate dehydrogenase [Candidatus Thermoplasmatota archaeon]